MSSHLLYLCLLLTVSAQQQGIDVSHYNGNVDWAMVQMSGVTYGIMKASQGNGYTDPTFQSNLNNARANGLTVGAYHMYDPTFPYGSQANHFFNVLNNSSFNCATDLAVVDVELAGPLTPGQYSDQLFGFIQLVVSNLNCNPIIYTGSSFWNTNIDWQRNNFGGYQLWVSNYGVVNPAIPAGWSSWYMWQYSQTGQVNGVNGNVDLDWINA